MGSGKTKLKYPLFNCLSRIFSDISPILRSPQLYLSVISSQDCWPTLWKEPWAVFLTFPNLTAEISHFRDQETAQQISLLPLLYPFQSLDLISWTDPINWSQTLIGGRTRDLYARWRIWELALFKILVRKCNYFIAFLGTHLMWCFQPLLLLRYIPQVLTVTWSASLSPSL